MRRVLAAVLALTTVLLLGACGQAVPPQPQRADAKHPNIVFVLTDDLSMNLVQHMPELQRMQTAGRTLDHYYVVDSLCCPSRASIFTGDYPHDTGVFTNWGSDGGIEAFHRYGDQHRCFATALQKAGYRTAFMGKYLNGYTPQTMGPEPGWDDWVVGGAGGYRELGYSLNENGTVRHYGRKPSDYMVDVLSRKAAGFIRDSASTDRAFMLEVATYAPHDPFVPPARYRGTMAHVPYPRTAAYDAEVRDAPRWLKGHAPLRPAEERLIRSDWERRLEADLAVDDLLTNLRRTIAQQGIQRDTYVVFSSDNGLHMGEYRLTPGKETAFDTDVHVPLVVTGPGVPAGTHSSAIASSIDLAPTFRDLAGAGQDPRQDGASLAASWHGHESTDPQRGVLIEHHHREGVPEDPDLQNARSADPPAYDAVRTADALLVEYADGEQEYYDTTKDPDELVNRAKEGVPAGLTRMLHALRTCSGARDCAAAARTG